VAEVGQTIDLNKPLATIAPSGSKLQANLFAKSRSVGFIKPGAKVLLRYQAFPYQKFGHHKGTVSSISRTALSSSEFSTFIHSTDGEPLYRIVVDLDSQYISAYGEKYSLHAGMMVDADILLEKRNLYEWILEPIFSLSGKM
jgi:membrane fusion protein